MVKVKQMDLENILKGLQMPNISKGMRGFSLSKNFQEYYQTKAPTFLQRYFSPEYGYLSSQTRKFDGYLQELFQEKAEEFQQDPSQLLDKKVIDLLMFKDPNKQRRVVEEAHQFLEDFSYMAKVGYFETYKILDVKYNTPIVGYFARKKVKSMGGLQNFDDFCSQVDQYKDKSFKFLKRFYPDQTPHQDSSEMQLVSRYLANVRNLKKHSVLSEYLNRGSVPNLTERVCYDNLSREEILRRDLSYSFNSYNSFFETVVGTIGSFIKYIFKPNPKRRK